MAGDSDIPTTMGDAVLKFLWNSSPFIFVLISLERLVEGKYDQAAAFAVAFIVNLVIVVFWNQIATFFRGVKVIALFVGLAVVGALALGIAMGGLFANRFSLMGGTINQSTGRITWNFDQILSGQASFLNMIRLNQDEIRVVGVGVHGKNISKDPITEFHGYVRSDLTNARLPIFIMAEEPSNVSSIPNPFHPQQIPTRPEETFGIPALADFDIVTFENAIFNQGVDGVPVSLFLRDFGSFTVVLEYDGTKIERQFSSGLVHKAIETFEKSLNPQRTTMPRVTRRPNATAPVQSLLPFPPPSSQNPPAATGSSK